MKGLDDIMSGAQGRVKALGRIWQVIDNVELVLDGPFEEIGLDLWMVVAFGSVVGAKSPRRPGLLFVYDDNPFWEDADLCDEFGICDDCWGETYQALALSRRRFAVDWVETRSLRYWLPSGPRSRSWPRPQVIWIAGERVGPLWTDIYKAETPEDVAKLNRDLNEGSFREEVHELMGVLPPRESHGDSGVEAWRFVRGLARHKARRAVDVAGLFAVHALPTQGETDLARDRWGEYRRELALTELPLTARKMPPDASVRAWDSLLFVVERTGKWAEEIVSRALPDGATAPGRDELAQVLAEAARSIGDVIAVDKAGGVLAMEEDGREAGS